ncbi:hypothetical protein BKA81DRAFT_436898 [Phyllosticta paracitricarpa]
MIAERAEIDIAENNIAERDIAEGSYASRRCSKTAQRNKKFCYHHKYIAFKPSSDYSGSEASDSEVSDPSYTESSDETSEVSDDEEDWASEVENFKTKDAIRNRDRKASLRSSATKYRNNLPTTKKTKENKSARKEQSKSLVAPEKSAEDKLHQILRKQMKQLKAAFSKSSKKEAKDKIDLTTEILASMHV